MALAVRATTEEELEAVTVIVARLGIGPVMPIVLTLAKHTAIRPDPLPIVARVFSSVPLHQVHADLAREVLIAGYLSARHAPVVRPTKHIDPGPHIHRRCAMIFWTFILQRSAASDADARLAAHALGRFHEAFSSFSEALPVFTGAVDACGELLAACYRIPALRVGDRRFLHLLYLRLRGALNDYTSDYVPLHGDAHLGNALVSEAGAIWADFEAVCVGPRVWDIACMPENAWPAFDAFDLARCFAGLRKLCVAVWCRADYGRSPQVDEAADHHLRYLKARFG